MAKYGYGVDIGGTAVKMGLFTDEGKLIEKWSIDTNTAEAGAHVLPDIADSIKANIAARELKLEDILGIGMGVPGPVDASGLITCVNLGWKDYPAVATLEGLTGLKVRCGNDANVAALGEAWMGGGAGCKNVIMVTLGTGVGGGIIIDGKILQGAHGAAGEIGHLPIKPDDTRRCNCGNRGCLELYTSANGNVRVAQDYLAEVDTPSPLRDYEKLDSKICWDYAIAGDPVAVEIADRFCRLLGIGLATIANTIDPEAFIIGGGVSKTGEPLRVWSEKYYKEYAFHAVRGVEIRLAKLGNDAGIFGAMRMLMV